MAVKFPEFFLRKFSGKSLLFFPEIAGKIPPEISHFTTLDVRYCRVEEWHVIKSHTVGDAYC